MLDVYWDFNFYITVIFLTGLVSMISVIFKNYEKIQEFDREWKLYETIILECSFLFASMFFDLFSFSEEHKAHKNKQKVLRGFTQVTWFKIMIWKLSCPNCWLFDVFLILIRDVTIKYQENIERRRLRTTSKGCQTFTLYSIPSQHKFLWGKSGRRKKIMLENEVNKSSDRSFKCSNNTRGSREGKYSNIISYSSKFTILDYVFFLHYNLYFSSSSTHRNILLYFTSIVHHHLFYFYLVIHYVSCSTKLRFCFLGLSQCFLCLFKIKTRFSRKWWKVN